MALITLDKVTKRFRKRRGKRVLIGRGGLADWVRGRRTAHFDALKGVSLEVNEGECLGIIGHNGSGKSTLLKLIAGVTIPSSGSVTVRGRVASLLELGAGFHPMLTGRENIYLNGSLLGMRRRDVDRVFGDIVEFSGIGSFIDSPVDTYSSGMFVRLGFSVAVHSNPDVFLVDEVLNVGDEAFQRQCRRRIGELMEEGKTIVFVSHDLNIVHTLCDRVVLMSQGELLQRETPQATIEFYLRQVGGAEAVHTLRRGAHEAIFCHGRISLYQDQHEITAPQGLSIRLRSLGQDHDSSSASWHVTERREDGCTAEGRMLNLPLSLIYELQIEEGRLLWRLFIEVRREMTLDALYLAAHFPVAYEEWVCGDFAGRFPPIEPGDQQAVMVAPTQYGFGDAAALPGDASGLPPVLIQVATPAPYDAAQWFNTAFLESSRFFEAFFRLGEEAEALQPGRRPVFEMSLRMAGDRKEVEEWIQDRTARRNLSLGDLAAQLDRGCIQLRYRGEPISHFLHVYSCMLIGGLWNDSTALKWQAPQLEQDGLSVVGESRRFAFRQHWRLQGQEGRLHLTIDIEVLEPLEVQEYQVSAVLRPEYSRWSTGHERGTFPPFDPASEDWRHVNRDYRPGPFVEALSDSLPCVRLSADREDKPFRPTVINTDAHYQGRVLQLLRTGAQGGVMRFGPGRWPYFSGSISVWEKEET